MSGIFGGLLAASAIAQVFVEDVFSTYLYTGNGATQTITTGIDLAGKGGMLWIKARTQATNHIISDTVRGAGNFLMSNASSQQFFNTDNVSALSSTGFSVGVDSNTNGTAAAPYVSWTFREAPNFFDVVTWTGNGGSQPISHALGGLPGFIMYKATNTTSDWFVLARNSNGAYSGLRLNLTSAAIFTGGAAGLGITATTFDPNSSWGNTNGTNYVAYLFAHDPSADGIIQCGSFTTNGAQNASVTLGWEPQWVMVKSTNQGYNWEIYDNMRGIGSPGTPHKGLMPNTSGAEFSATGMSINATGFATSSYWGASTEMIYIAIRAIT